MLRAASVLLILLLPSAGALDPLGRQDDAGSGGDAGDDRGGAVALLAGAYTGRLATLKAPYLRDPLLDQSDWYRIQAGAGERLELEVALLSGDAVTFEIRGPDGALAGWTVASTSTPRSVHVVTNEGGPWYVHAFAFNSFGGAYSFALSASPAPGAAALAGTGWLALTVDVAPGTPFRGAVTTSIASGWEALRADLYVINDDGSLRFGVIDALAGAEGAFAVGGLEGGLEVRTHGNAWVRSTLDISISAPGRYHVVAIAKGTDVYTFYDDGPAPSIVATGRKVFALRPSEFESTVGVSAVAVEATFGGRATLQVRDGLVGAHSCGRYLSVGCTVEEPGSPPAAVGGAFWGRGAPGTWTFTRDRVGDTLLGGYELLAADVRLPRA